MTAIAFSTDADDQAPEVWAIGKLLTEQSAGDVARQLIACVVVQPIDKLDGLPLVRMRQGAPPLPIVQVRLDGHDYVLSADHARRVALELDGPHRRKGAALDLLQLCDDAEAVAARIARAN